jgi:NAD dependent epimerase/dehydratase family enzyme
MFAFIHKDDLIAAIELILSRNLDGIFNLCSPNPTDNATFARSLAKASGARWIIRIPTFLLRIGLGEAHIMVTEGPGVVPARVLREGFVFRFPGIDEALENLLQSH